jgi:hypothetical protein
MDETLRPGETTVLYFVVAGIDRIHPQSHQSAFRLDPGNLALSLRWDKAKLNGGIDLWKLGKQNES